jgi:hypothetical protein
VSAPPPGYRLRPPARLAASTRRKRPATEIVDARRVLRILAEAGDWYALRFGHEGAPTTNALNDRGVLEIAVPDRPGRPFLYRITDAGRRLLAEEREWAPPSMGRPGAR